MNPFKTFKSCFLNILSIVKDLKTNGHLKEAFELAKKTADSNDVTGISQMILGIMYDFGEGTDKNPSLAIKWLKSSLEKITDRDLHLNVLLSLAAVYEEIKDYKNAQYYAKQCAALGDKDCTTALQRLAKIH